MQTIFNEAVTYGPTIIAACAAAAAVFPPGAPGTVWGVIRSTIDILAINVGNAKNAK